MIYGKTCVTIQLHVTDACYKCLELQACLCVRVRVHVCVCTLRGL